MSLFAAAWPQFAVQKFPPTCMILQTIFHLFTDIGSSTILILNE